MEGAAGKPKGRRRPVRKADAGAATAAGPDPAGGVAAAAVRPAGTDATAAATEQTEAAQGAAQPKPSLSQRVTRSLRQLSQRGTTSKTEEHEEVQQQQQQGLAGEPAPPLAVAPDAAAGGHNQLERTPESEGEEEQEDGGAAGRTLGKLRRGAATLRRRLSELHDTARLPASLPISAPAAVASLLLALALLGGLLGARQAAAGGRQLAALRSQVEGQLETAAADRSKLSSQVAHLHRQLERLSAQQAAAAKSVAELQKACTSLVGRGADLAADLAGVRADIAGLQAEAAVVASAAAAALAAAEGGGGGGGSSMMGASVFDEKRVRQLAKDEASAELDVFAADRTGQADWALAAGGAAVVAHSAAHMPPALGSPRLTALRDKLQGGIGFDVHPQANKLLLGPVSQPGSCLPLVGTSGWVDVRLARPIRPSALSYEHIPSSIAYDIRTAPRSMSVLGFTGRPPPVAPGAGPAGGARTGASASGASQGVPLGSFAFDAHARRALQTFSLAAAGSAGAHGSESGRQQPPLIDHIRLVIHSNHGHPDYTCVYRLRMHGTPLLPVV